MFLDFTESPEVVARRRKSSTLRLLRFLIITVWVALGPLLVFETGMYVGLVREVQEDHYRDAYYELVPGQSLHWPTPYLQKLQNKGTLYFWLSIVWVTATIGAWSSLKAKCRGWEQREGGWYYVEILSGPCERPENRSGADF